MKHLSLIFSFVVGCAVIVAVGTYCYCAHSTATSPTEIIVYTEDPNKVYNIFEMQERLKAQGLYKGKIDGIWGPLMDKAYCDYCAIRDIEGR